MEYTIDTFDWKYYINQYQGYQRGWNINQRKSMVALV